MDERLLKLLKKILSDIGSPGSEKLVPLLYKKSNVNEFQIAKKLGGTINQTRNILYRLADHGLIGFVRKKDKKKGGWYTYYWTLKLKKILQNHKEGITKQILGLDEQLHAKETDRFFYCANCETEYNEENAMLHEFTCPECGEVLQMKNTTEILEKIKKEKEKLEEIVAQLEQEIKTIENKEQASQRRKLKAEAKKMDLKKKAVKKIKKREERKERRKKIMLMKAKKGRKKIKKKGKKKKKSKKLIKKKVRKKAKKGFRK